MNFNFSIRYQVLFVAVIGVVGFVIYFYLSYLNSLEHEVLFKDISASDLPILEQINGLSPQLYQIEKDLRSAKSLEEIELARTKVYKLDSAYKQLKTLDPTGQALLDRLRSRSEDYTSVLLTLSEGRVRNNISKAKVRQLTSDARNLREEIDRFINQYRGNRFNIFQQKFNGAAEINERAFLQGLVGGFVLIVVIILTAWVLSKRITSTLAYIAAIADRIAEGDWQVKIKEGTLDETGLVLNAIAKMRESLRARSENDHLREEEQTRMASLIDVTRGDNSTVELCQKVIRFICPLLDAQVGALYVEQETKLKLIASFAFSNRKGISDEFALGQGIIGQVALERSQVVLSQIPEDYMAITSSLGESRPRFIIVTPIVFEETLYGVLELGFIEEPGKQSVSFLEKASESIARSISSAQAREGMTQMLETTKKQAQELEDQQNVLTTINEDLEAQAMALSESQASLQAQQEELRVSNEELEEQASALKSSEEKLQAQQEELRVTNEELEEHTRALEKQKDEMRTKNLELERSKNQLEEKSEALELSSKYKSEFLSTMSHELRTPLNSILILSGNLAENKDDRLSEKQVEHASVIKKAGTDLLDLINDILDLSKVEEGKLELLVDEISFKEWAKDLEQLFTPVSEDKGIGFEVLVDKDIDDVFTSDIKRLNQVIKNLISNALKFTEQGEVKVQVTKANPDAKLLFTKYPPEELLAFSVTDTGIGIRTESQQIIFEAFQQSDGAISRKFGGTGLGLTISNQLARLLGGEITVSSDGEGCGSCFTLYIPSDAPEQILSSEATVELFDKLDADAEIADVVPNNDELLAPNYQGDDEEEQTAAANKPTSFDHILIIEDDPAFGSALGDLAEEYGLKATVVPDGEVGLQMAKDMLPSGIILDVKLPGMDGWEVIEALREDDSTKDIPVHFMSGTEEKEKALSLGAIDFLKKPADKETINEVFRKLEGALEGDVKKLLLIESKESESQTVIELFKEKSVSVDHVSTGKDAFKSLRSEQYDCIVLDLDLSDMSGIALLQQIQEEELTNDAPVIIYTEQNLEREEEAELRKYADRIILKSGEYAERLISEASLFLHWLESKQEDYRPTKLGEHRDELFEDKCVMIVDDDMRNVYSLTTELENAGLAVEPASSGSECIETLEAGKLKIDAILMDIMMPELDGFSTIEQIRAKKEYKDIPIIVLTAKTLKEDKAKCIELGANDYLQKPIDVPRLLSLLRVWLTQ